MSKGRFWIEGHGFKAVFLRDRAKIETKQHASGEQIRGGRIRWHTKHSCEGSASLGVFFGLYVGDAQDIGSVDIRARIPVLNFFEKGDGVGRFACKIEREPGELDDFAIVGFFLLRGLQAADGIGIVALLVIGDTKFVIEAFGRRSLAVQGGESSDGFVVFALLQKFARAVVGGVRCRGDGGLWSGGAEGRLRLHGEKQQEFQEKGDENKNRETKLHRYATIHCVEVI